MKKPRICAVIVNDNLKAVKEVEPFADLLEVRIDLIGDGWQELAGQLSRPWIACNRQAEEGGRWQESEAERIAALLQAVDLGADIVDIELRTENLKQVVAQVKQRAKCLLSFHELAGTPPLDEMKEIVNRQLAAGADICKVVATAQSFADNRSVLQLIADFPQVKVVSFAMGPLGSISRILSPLIGGYFTYASIKEGEESAPGQITVGDLREIYEMVAE